MKKNICTLCLLTLIANVSFGQIYTIPKVSGEYEYSSIITLDSTYKKDDLYRNAKLYFVDNYKSAKDVIQYDDKDQGKIIGKGLLYLKDYQSLLITGISETREIYYSTEIVCKDGKYKYKLYDFSIKRTIQSGNGSIEYSTITIDEAYEATNKGMTKKMAIRLYDKMVYHLKSSIEFLKLYMSKKESTNKDEF